MKFSDLKPGDLFTFNPRAGGRWHDRNLYRKATRNTYHRADKVLMIKSIGSVEAEITPETSDGSRRYFGQPGRWPASASECVTNAQVVPGSWA